MNFEHELKNMNSTYSSPPAILIILTKLIISILLFLRSDPWCKKWWRLYLVPDSVCLKSNLDWSPSLLSLGSIWKLIQIPGYFFLQYLTSCAPLAIREPYNRTISEVKAVSLQCVVPGLESSLLPLLRDCYIHQKVENQEKSALVAMKVFQISRQQCLCKKWGSD